MSLYTIEEICDGCKHADICECCLALKGCKENVQEDVNHFNGECESREVDTYNAKLTSGAHAAPETEK